MTRHAFLCDAIRTPFGRYGGALASVRADDLGAIPIAALMSLQLAHAALRVSLCGPSASGKVGVAQRAQLFAPFSRLGAERTRVPGSGRARPSRESAGILQSDLPLAGERGEHGVILG